MRYKLLARIDAAQTDLLDGVRTVTIGPHILSTSTGEVYASATNYAINVGGFEVSEGQELYIKGFSRMVLYSGVGRNETEWMAKFLTGVTVDAEGFTYTVAAGVGAIRFRKQTDDLVPAGITRWYIVAGSLPLIAVWSKLDLGDDQPAMTYQSNDIAELKDRQADYSQELKLPLTAHNLTVLGLPDHTDSQTDLPYRTVDCRLYADEYELAGKGAILVIDGVTEAIECQVLGSSASLFDLLEEAPMSDISEPTFLREYGLAMAPVTFPEGLEFVAASFSKSGLHQLYQMDPRYMLPVVNDLHILGKILDAHGYSWVHNLAGYAGTDRNALAVVTLDPDADSLVNLEGSAGAFIITALAAYYYRPGIGNSASGQLTTTGPDVSLTPVYTVYTAICDCSVKVRYARTVVVGAGGRPKYFDTALVHSGTGEDLVESLNTEELSFELTVSLSKGDTLALSVHSIAQTGTPDPYQYRHDLWVEEFTSDFVPLHGLVHAPRNLGFDTQFDYFKAFVQRYGLTVKVDHATSTVYTYTMRQVYDNKTFARDWSDKLVEREAEMSFRADGYARSNDIAFKDNDEDNVTDKGTFTVADAALEKEKILFDLPFEAGLDWGVTTKYASVPVFDVPDIDDVITTPEARLEAAEYAGGKPHLLRVSTDEVTMTITDYADDAFHRATHVTAQSLIDTYYTELTDSMLVKAKHRTDRFYLTPADIEAFDPFVPVYIRQYGAYFYVNKISNFIVGRLTSVELIKL